MATRQNTSPTFSTNKRPRLNGYLSSDDDGSVEGPARPGEPDQHNIALQSDQAEDDSDSEDGCVICLQTIVDRTIIPTCLHDRFCFECLELWTSKSRKCPLCKSVIGSYVIHNVRSQYDFQKYYLPPLRTSPAPAQRPQSPEDLFRRSSRRAPEVVWGRREQEQDALERAVEKRKWVYRHNLYAKHVASNRYTKYKPYPSPSQFASSPDMISKATAFVRRELRVWPNLDIEFLTTFIISLMKSIDIRHESAVKLLSEFLDIGMPYSEVGRKVNAEHFAHELYTYLRSPHRELSAFDSNVQYDAPDDIPLTSTSRRRHDRWAPSPRGTASPSPSRGRHSNYQPDDILDFSPRDYDISISPPRRERSTSRSQPSEQDSERGSHGRPRRQDQIRTSRSRKGKAKDSEQRVIPGQRGSSNRSHSGSMHNLRLEPNRFDPPKRSASHTSHHDPKDGEVSCEGHFTNNQKLVNSEPSSELSVRISSREAHSVTQATDFVVDTIHGTEDCITDQELTRGQDIEPVDGISIKGASLGNANPGLSIKGAAERSLPFSEFLSTTGSLPLLTRISTNSIEIPKGPNRRTTPSPSDLEVLSETRAQLATRREAKGKEIERNERPDISGPSPRSFEMAGDQQLLEKLKEERFRHEGKLEITDGPNSDLPTQKEAQLRSQVRIRVKLAAEKRKADEREAREKENGLRIMLASRRQGDNMINE